MSVELLVRQVLSKESSGGGVHFTWLKIVRNGVFYSINVLIGLLKTLFYF